MWVDKNEISSTIKQNRIVKNKRPLELDKIKKQAEKEQVNYIEKR